MKYDIHEKVMEFGKSFLLILVMCGLIAMSALGWIFLL